MQNWILENYVFKQWNRSSTFIVRTLMQIIFDNEFTREKLAKVGVK